MFDHLNISGVDGYGNCGIVATAIMADVEYSKVEKCFMDLKGIKTIAKAKKYQRAWSGGTYEYERIKVLKELGFSTKASSCVLTFGKEPAVKTFVNLIKAMGLEQTKIMCRIRGHAFVLYNGKVYDQVYHEGREINKCAFKNRRVTSFVIAEKN